MTQTLNQRLHGRPAGSVYVGRPSKWGNPFIIGRDGDRAAVIAKHRDWIQTQPKLLECLGELAGHDLVCWCAPDGCHADTLRELAALVKPTIDIVAITDPPK
jgi:hypothetical protein